MNVFVPSALPVFCHNKVAESFVVMHSLPTLPAVQFHLKKRKVGEAVKERPCWKLSSHSKGTGIRKFLT